MHNRFFNCVSGNLDLDIIKHSDTQIDLALIKFKNYSSLLCDHFPVFAKTADNLKPGFFLCRLGFPFPEFSNYKYNEIENKIEWTEEGRHDSPSFPIEGMVTRLAGDSNGVNGFELSTPGIKGQSGGPVFANDGRIFGVQFATLHLDLNKGDSAYLLT